MKNKSKSVTILLILAVILIWTIVGYKIYTALFDTSVNMISSSMPVSKGELRIEESFQFDLNANYRDPFLEGSYNVSPTNNSIDFENKSNRIKKVISKPITKPKVSVDFSFISFKGLIKNQMSNKHVALVEMNNNEIMVKEGEIINEVQFIKYYKDSIKVSYKGDMTFIKRSN